MITILKRLAPRTFNDVLAIIVFFSIVALWILDGLSTIELEREIIGATIMALTMVIQYYYRKAKGEAEGKASKQEDVPG